MERRCVRTHHERLLDERFRFPMAPHVTGEQSQQVERIGMTRLPVNHGAIVALGAGCIPGPMRRKPPLE
jgi:hypothetical protein